MAEKKTPTRHLTATAIDREMEDLSREILKDNGNREVLARFEKLQSIRRDSLFSGQFEASPVSVKLRRVLKQSA